MPTCCVVSCRSKRKLHRFPRDPEIRNQWILATRQPAGWAPRADDRICSYHFLPSAITPTGRVRNPSIPVIAGKSFLHCCGSGMFIPDPTFFHPGSRIRTVSIPDPGSSSKNLSILTPKKAIKWFLSSKKYDPGCSSRIPDPAADFLPSRIPDPGVKKAPNPGSGSATLHFLIIV
jgi:hypothetical protein